MSRLATHFARRGDALPLCGAITKAPAVSSIHEVNCPACKKAHRAGKNDLRHPWMVGPTPKWSKRRAQRERVAAAHRVGWYVKGTICCPYRKDEVDRAA